MITESRPRLFVSYAREDEVGAEALVQRIRACGIECSRGDSAIRFGEGILERVRGLIREHTHLLVYLSKSALDSHWVSFEIGVASGLGREVLAFLAESNIAPRGFVADVRHVHPTELEDFAAQLIRFHDERLKSRMNVVQREASDSLYYFPEGFVGAVRLLGADDERWLESDVDLTYDPQPLDVLADFLELKSQTLARLERQAQERNAPFFNGPNTRLRSWSDSPRDGMHAAEEHKRIALHLGPVGWHDYEGLNGAFRESLQRATSSKPYEQYLSLSLIKRRGDVSGSRLSNILDVAVTIVSSDGQLGYQLRGRVASEPDRLTSSVAENINRYLDDADPRNSSKLFRAQHGTDLERHPVNPDYQPNGVPHPFATVRRGIAEELSRSLLDFMPATHSIQLIGLSFDLASLHPDALFMVALPLTASEILRICHEDPGKDYPEGRVRFTRAHFGEPETRDLLLHERWTPGGMASFVRTLQVLDSLQSRHGIPLEAVIAQLLLPARVGR